MMIDRRDFIKAGVMASAATAIRGELATAQPLAAAKTFQVSLGLKGQFLYLTPVGSGQPEAVCLKSPEGPMHHYGWLFVASNGVAASQPEPQYTSKDGQWRGWKIESGLPVEFKGAGVKPEVGRGRGGRRAASGTKGKHWPANVNEEKDWESPDWIPSLKELAPHLAVDKNKLDLNTFFRVVLPAGGTFSGKKPCKVRDVIALWKWETNNDEVLKAATDRVQYTTMFAISNEVTVAFQGGFVRLKRPENGSLVACELTCAPDLSQSESGPMYELDDEVEHFDRFNQVLTKAELPRMRFLCPTKPPTGVHPGTCPAPLEDRDDDIFCPGMGAPKP